MQKNSRLFLPLALMVIFVSTTFSGSCQNYSAAYFKSKAYTANTTNYKILLQKHVSNGFYVKIARDLLGSDFVITNASGVMVLMGTFNNDSYTFDMNLFKSVISQDYFLSVFRDNKQLVNEKLNL